MLANRSALHARSAVKETDAARVGYIFQAARLLCLVVAWLVPTVSVGQSSPGGEVPAAAAALEEALVGVIARSERCVVAVSRTVAGEVPLVFQGLGDAFAELRENTPQSRADSIVGAGVIVDRAGFVLTHYLAVREGDEHFVTTRDGGRYRATIHGADPRSGLAMLEIASPADGPADSASREDAAEGSFPAIELGDASRLRKGQFVVAIGNPYAIASDGQATASWGTLTNMARKAPVGENLNDAPGPSADFRTTLHHLGTLLQTDAKVGWSAAGGALVNLRGELIGVITTTATIAGHEQPAGYAIPINPLMRRVIDTLRLGREVEYGMLGVGFGPAVADASKAPPARLSVAQVYPGGPAARAGLQAGDVITRIAEEAVDDIDAVQLAISGLPPSTTTTIAYERDGRAATARVTLAKLAAAGNVIATSRPDPWRGLRVDYATALDATQLARAINSGAYDVEGCVLVAEVEKDSVAWRAGVRPGTFISHVGGRRVSTPAEFQAAVSTVGDEFAIRLTQPPPGDEKSDPANASE